MSLTKRFTTSQNVTATKFGRLLYFHGQITGKIWAGRQQRAEAKGWIIPAHFRFLSTHLWRHLGQLKQTWPASRGYGHQTWQLHIFIWEAYRENISWPPSLDVVQSSLLAFFAISDILQRNSSKQRVTALVIWEKCIKRLRQGFNCLR